MRSLWLTCAALATAALLIGWHVSSAAAGRPPTYMFGRSVAAVGDVDGDGVTDLLVGSCGEAQLHAPDPLAAAAVLYSGKDGRALRHLRASAGDPRGTAVAGVGDLNKDGIPDFAVGTRTASADGTDYATGQVEAFSGADGALLWTARGSAKTESHEQFGWSVGVAGDVNGDGTPDVVAGSLSLSVARVLSGKDGAILFEWKGPNAKKSDDFGRAVAGNVDMNADGRPDILVGAPFHGIGSTHAPPRGPGQVTLFSGKDGRVLFTVKGETRAELFGEAVAFIADVNGDGKPDFLVGAPSFSPSGRNFAGRVYVISGGDGSVLRRIDGLDAGGQLGTSVAAVGDVDGDGTPDVLAGAPRPGSDGTRESEKAEWGGCARVFSGRTGKVLFTLRAPKKVEPYLFAEGVVGLPDVSGDKIPDLLVGAPGTGAVLYSGATGEVLRVLR